MPSLNFTTSYKKNTGLMISPSEFRVLFFYGTDIQSKDGTNYSEDTYELNIRQAQEEIEKYLEVKLIPGLVEETQSFNKDEYLNQFPVIQTNMPVNKPYALLGLLNKTEQMIFPESWLNNRTGNQGFYARRISLVPTGATASKTSGDMILTGITFQMGMMSFKNIPDYYTVQYLSGFEKINYDLLNLVGMLAAIPTLAIAGDLILGAGIASQSVSIDGLSNSISSTSSATNAGYGARITEYRKTIKETLEKLKYHYKGIRFTSM